jgi:uncharacterized alpha-E superfamily protein
VISRVADQCLWLGRYLERAESGARLLQATRTLVFDADIPVTECWRPLVIVSGAHPAFLARHDEATAETGEVVQAYMTWDPENMVSLRSCVRAARETAQAIRDVLSLETWEEINALYWWLHGADGPQSFDRDRDQFFRHVRRATQLCLGLVRSTMLHDDAMSFLWLGVMLERVGQTARILDMHHHILDRRPAHQIVEVALWLSLLRACSCYEAFMKSSQGRVTARAVLAFLLFSEEFPRSLRYCATSAQQLLRRIWPFETTPARASTAVLGELLRWLRDRERHLDEASSHEIFTHIVDRTAEICVAVEQEILGPRPTEAARPEVEQ